MNHVDGVSCIKGEIHSVMTSMRLSTRWSNVKTQKKSDFQEESQFVISFRKLNEYLEGIFVLDDVDCVLYITPFYDVVVSDQASGPLTSVALSSLCKFAMFGFLSTKYPRSQEGIALIANCVSRCIFEETDWESDEVILMKLLELSTLILRCDASKLLTVELMWDIYNTCLSIHNQSRASKILRSEAETVIRHITQSTFSKAHSISGDFEALQTWENTKGEYFFDGSAGITVLLCNIMKVLVDSMNLQTETPSRVKFSLSILNIALEAGGPVLSTMESLVGILNGDVCRHLLRATQSDDLEIFSVALRIIFNLFMSIKDHMKVQLEVFLTSIHLRILQNNNTASFLGQAKEELALESLLEFCREPSLMQDLYTNYDCDIQCSNLFDTIISVLCEKSQPLIPKNPKKESTKDDSALLNVEYKPAITIINRLAISGVSSILHALSVKCRKSRTTLSFLKSVQNHETKSMIQSMLPNERETSVSSDTSQTSVTFASVGETVTETGQWTPPLTQQTSESEPASPSLSVSGSASNLSINGTLDIENDRDTTFVQVISNPVEILRMRKLKKQRLLHTAELFNEKPLKFDYWIKYALDHQLVKAFIPPSLPPMSTSSENSMTEKSAISAEDKYASYPADPKSVARFLKETPNLGKTQIGEFISKGPADIYPFHAAVLQEYVDTFDFAGGQDASFVKALRTFLGHFRLPGEAQCIDRLMEAFAKKLFQDLGVGKPFLSADAAFVLAFSTIMLQTDLHNPNVTHKRMSQEEFIRNNRGINDGESLPKEYLEALYDEIKSKKIEVNIEINDTAASSKSQVFNLTDTASWDKLMKKSAAFQAPANFTPNLKSHKKKNNVSSSSGSTNTVNLSLTMEMHEKDMFLVMEDRILSTILMLWQYSEDDKIISKAFKMLWDYENICIDLSLTTLFNQVFQTCIMKTRTIIDTCRKSQTNDLVTNKTISNTFYQKLWALECMYGKHELQKLLKMSTEDLLTVEKSKNIPMLIEAVNWIGVSLVKGELMGKFIMCLAERFWSSIDRQSWSSLLYFLLWIRSRGSLPSALTTISYQWNLDMNNTTPTIDFSRFQPSIYVVMCNRRIRGMSDRQNLSQSNHMKQKNSNTWLGGLFWSAGGGKGDMGNFDSDGNGTNDINSNSDMTNFDLNVSLYNDVLQQQFQTENSDNINMDKLLAVALHEHPFQYCFDIPVNKSACGEELSSVILEILSSVVSHLLSCDNGNTMSISLFNASSPSPSSSPIKKGGSIDTIYKTSDAVDTLFPKCGVFELDAVFLLELLTKISANQTKSIISNWFRIHAIMKLILEDDLESACTNAPFFLERLSLFVIRCACEVIPHVSTESYSLNVMCSSKTKFTTSESSNTALVGLKQLGVESIWQTLRLLRNLPSEFMEGISGQIGQALLYFVRPAQTRIRCIVTLEEWYVTFSLMSNVIMRADARPFIWMILHHLINSNLICDTNFSPARNLLLRFLYGIFVDENSNGNSTSGTRKHISIEWQQQSMICLVKLTNMALGGYINYATTNIQQNQSTNYKQRIEYVTFPLPSPRGNSPRHLPHTNAMLITDSASMTVPCVFFSRTKTEIESFWIETCKTFCDLSNAGDPCTSGSSQQALFCLEAVLLSGTFSGMNKDAYLKVIDEILTRLPLSLLLANDRVQNASHSNNTTQTIDLVYEYCIDACDLLLHTILRMIQTLKPLSGFQSSWLRFISILATNSNMLVRGTHIHNKMLDILASLLQILKISKDFSNYEFINTDEIGKNNQINESVASNNNSPVDVSKVEEVVSLLASEASQQSHSHISSSSSSSSSAIKDTAGSGWLGWWTANPAKNTNKPSATNTDTTSVVTSLNVEIPISSQEQIQNAELISSPPIEEKITAVTPVAEVISQNSSSSSSDMKSTFYENDDALLCITWKTATTLYPSLSVHLRIKYPQLVTQIASFIEKYEKIEFEARVKSTTGACVPSPLKPSNRVQVV